VVEEVEVLDMLPLMLLVLEDQVVVDVVLVVHHIAEAQL
jgi:hypothetical protein